jgi:hypothetical protein
MGCEDGSPVPGACDCAVYYRLRLIIVVLGGLRLSVKLMPFVPTILGSSCEACGSGQK